MNFSEYYIERVGFEENLEMCYTLQKGINLIGRSCEPNIDITINSMRCSPCHCTITVNSNCVEFQNLSKNHGTVLNDVKIKSDEIIKLKENDIIGIVTAMSIPWNLEGDLDLFVYRLKKYPVENSLSRRLDNDFNTPEKSLETGASAVNTPPNPVHLTNLPVSPTKKRQNTNNSKNFSDHRVNENSTDNYNCEAIQRNKASLEAISLSEYYLERVGFEANVKMRLNLKKGCNLVGRKGAPKVDVGINSVRCSPRQCLISVARDFVAFRNVNETHGTALNDITITSSDMIKLKENDIIGIVRGVSVPWNLEGNYYLFVYRLKKYSSEDLVSLQLDNDLNTLRKSPETGASAANTSDPVYYTIRPVPFSKLTEDYMYSTPPPPALLTTQNSTYSNITFTKKLEFTDFKKPLSNIVDCLPTWNSKNFSEHRFKKNSADNYNYKPIQGNKESPEAMGLSEYYIERVGFEANMRMRFNLKKGKNMIGRRGTPRIDIGIHSIKCSARHCIITVTDNSVELQNLSYTKGTTVNNVRITSNDTIKLIENDTIAIVKVGKVWNDWNDLEGNPELFVYRLKKHSSENMLSTEVDDDINTPKKSLENVASAGNPSNPLAVTILPASPSEKRTYKDVTPSTENSTCSNNIKKLKSTDLQKPSSEHADRLPTEYTQNVLDHPVNGNSAVNCKPTNNTEYRETMSLSEYYIERIGLEANENMRFDLKKGANLIGRRGAPNIDIGIDSTLCSPRQCIITVTNDCVEIQNISETSGISVNGTKIMNNELVMLIETDTIGIVAAGDVPCNLVGKNDSLFYRLRKNSSKNISSLELCNSLDNDDLDPIFEKSMYDLSEHLDKNFYQK
ncbi:hypothetical protein Bhyg_06454 [Pseudolycoriella hygida]|uniref:FHA domain-containing protein n=1 Tax=Pseudolycoriella hygida TaxID=35572 RepID=A0A9Q0S2V0_9DIPT|nr:hypothetical protein Bhyg_06454 [Pseudolycoriella hygida]